MSTDLAGPELDLLLHNLPLARRRYTTRRRRAQGLHRRPGRDHDGHPEHARRRAAAPRWSQAKAGPAATVQTRRRVRHSTPGPGLLGVRPVGWKPLLHGAGPAAAGGVAWHEHPTMVWGTMAASESAAGCALSTHQPAGRVCVRARSPVHLCYIYICISLIHLHRL